MSSVKRPGAAAAFTVLLATGLTALPQPAHAWWRGGWGVGVVVPPVVVAPPVYVAPAPVYIGPPVVYARPPVAYFPAPRVWIPAHWRRGCWVPGYWR